MSSDLEGAGADRPNISRKELGDLVRESGFPFELDVCQRLLELDFENSPSHRIFIDSKNKDAEIDLVATYRMSVQTKRGLSVKGILNLAIECKDTILPFVCFGLKHMPVVAEGFVDPDHQYCSVASSRDRFPNEFALPVFDSKNPGMDAKSQHHQFVRDERFYVLAQVEGFPKPNKKSKLHVPASVESVFDKFACLVRQFRGQWAGLGPESIESVTGGPTIGFLFLMLVHTGEHYEHIPQRADPTPADSTSVMVSSGTSQGPTKFIVDVVKFENLDASVRKVQSTFSVLMRQLAPWLVAAQRRSPGRTPV